MRTLLKDLVEPEPNIKTIDDFGGDAYCFQFCVPGGIGDISWVCSKIKHLPAMLGKQVILTSGSKELPAVLHRAHTFIDLLPEVHWGGYLPQRESWDSVSQCLPSEWPDYMGWGPFHQKRPVNLSANMHLEMGRKLRDWLPMLPTDYHYDLKFTPEHEQASAKFL